ncbi:uncharacterized protein [Primulina huaijiensis]|uniref:uncharacterized protein n=1 Tax=Primulina huaijiensis TaxID=1492673 RepID=UPI003CC7801A
MGLSTNQKITAAMWMLAYCTPADAADEYIKIGESTTIQCLQRFCRDIVEVFAERSLRSPTSIDIDRLLRIGEKRGFLGMLGSLDCMHWSLKNCPTAWAGQYAGRSGSPTIILEAVADYDIWIWHAFFGMPESNNDINVLEASNLFSNLAQGIAPPANYISGGKEYHQEYYLADARAWQKKHLQDIMTACIIMHNMIIEDERDLDTPIQDALEEPTPNVEMVTDQNIRFQEFLACPNTTAEMVDRVKKMLTISVV